MKKHLVAIRVLFASFVLFCILSPIQVYADRTITPSPELKVLLQQTERAFLKPMGMDMKMALNQYPDYLASALGMALHRQSQYMNDTPALVDHFTPLREQTQEFLYALAEMHDYKMPHDGSPMTKQVMDDYMLRALGGGLNQFFINKFGTNPSTVNLPLMLTQVPPKGGSGGVRKQAKLIQEKESNKIELLGVESGGAGQATMAPAKGITKQKIPGLVLCPQKDPTNNRNSKDNYVRLPYKGVQTSSQYVSCRYVDGELYSQGLYGGNFSTSHRFGTYNGVRYLAEYSESLMPAPNKFVRHGKDIVWLWTKTGKLYVRMSDNYVNGKLHGKSETYETTPGGDPYLSSVKYHQNGVPVGTWKFYYLNESGKVARGVEATYSNGERVSSKEFVP